MLDPHDFEALLKQAFPDARLRLIDLTGGRDHYELHIACSAFVGLSRIKQHRLVYEALGTRVGDQVHALALQTLQLDEWRE